MMIHFTDEEKRIMEAAKISFHDGENNDDEAFELLDALHDAEVFYMQNGDEESYKISDQYARLADKVQDSIPD